MFNSPIFNLIILLSFTYFMGSLMLSSINEFIAAIFRMRQNHLKDAIGKLFFSQEWKTFTKLKFFKSPQIEALMKKPKRYPAYISASNFVRVIIEQIGPSNFNAVNIAGAITSSSLPGELKTVLSNLLAKAQCNMTEFEKEIESFYEEAMDRVTGWYKRKVRTVMFFISIVLAIVLNIDTLKISNDALSDHEKLDNIVNNISTTMSKMEKVNDSLVIKDGKGKVLTILKMSIDTASIETAAKDSLANDTTGIKNDIGKMKSDFNTIAVTYEQTTGYKLGYTTMKEFEKEWSEAFFLKLLGIIITVFALQLGANYWFDLLNKFVNLRAAGKKPEEKTK